LRGDKGEGGGRSTDNDKELREVKGDEEKEGKEEAEGKGGKVPLVNRRYRRDPLLPTRVDVLI
jgi:hypothetical protein